MQGIRNVVLRLQIRDFVVNEVSWKTAEMLSLNSGFLKNFEIRYNVSFSLTLFSGFIEFPHKC